MEQLAILTLIITSPAFEHEEMIPVQYTCDGKNVNPPLMIKGIPENTRSLALIVEDPDAPSGVWNHWVVWNIPVQHEIAEDSIPGKEGLNTFGKHHYGGPCPPSGTHRYFFKVYALDSMLELEKEADKKALMDAMEDHILAEGEIIGMYERH